MRNPLRSRAGVTLVELIITATVMSVMILTVLPLFNVTTKGYTSLEVNTVLSAGAQQAASSIQSHLSENKRFFGNDAVGTAFLARVTPNLTQTALTGSLLPSIDVNASLSPSSGTFISTNTGNCFLSAGVDQSVELTNVLNGSGVNTTVRLDTYVFNYYYLAPNPSLVIGGTSVRDLWEWHSVKYVDYLGLVNLPDVTQRNNAIAQLVAAPNNFLYAFNSSATVVTTAFYTLSGSNPWITVTAGHNIVRNKAGKMINLIRGTTIGSFVYSVSPNTNSSFNHRYVVPTYGTANGNFPSGFETLIVGPAGNRRAFARIVMAAKGSFKGYLAYEQVVLVAARDLW